jgi:DNA-binding NarL/FixJ family response regulator
LIKKRIKVLIADDSSITRSSYEFILKEVKDINVVASAKSIVELIKKTKKFKPDIVIIDLRWFEDKITGVEAIKDIKLSMPEIKIIAVSAYPELFREAREAGANEVLVKNFSRDEFISEIREVAVNRKTISEKDT